MRKLAAAAGAALLALALPLGAVQASPARAVHITVKTSFLPDGSSGGPFTASGPAADAGLVCPTGQTIDVSETVAGYQSQRGASLVVVKRFTCDNGSGDFLVKLEVRLDNRGHFAWGVTSGTGADANLQGAGTGYGTAPLGDYDVLDTYDGQVTKHL